MARKKISKRHRSMIIGISCGLACAFCVAVYAGQLTQQADAAQAEMLAKYGGDQIDVCVARHDIPAGQVISESDIQVKTWVASLLPQNAITDKNQAIGKQVGSIILAGEVVSTSRFGLETSDIDVPEGFSAISVPTKDVQAVGGSLKPGMRADIYAVGANSTSKIATSVLILATSATSDGSSQTSWITIAIKPSKIEEMVSAAQKLELYFVLPSLGAASMEANSPSPQDDSTEPMQDGGSSAEPMQEDGSHGIE